MKKLYPLVITLIFASCSLGHKEVKYSEMIAPPKVKLVGDEFVIKTERSLENPNFTIYEVIPTLDEGEKLILLKGHQSMGRESTGEFRVKIKDWKHDSLEVCRVFWVDPDNSKTQIRLEDDDKEPVKRDTIR